MPADSANVARRAATLRRATAVGLGVMFLWAGSAKIVEIERFAWLIDTLLAAWVGGRGLPLGGVRDTLSVVVPMLEIGLGLTLVLANASRAGPFVAAGLVLASFAVILVAMALSPDPPHCGCFGSWLAGADDARRAAWFGTVRNVGLAILAFWVAAPFSRARPAPPGPTSGEGRSRAAFSLIEMLVVIAVIAVLLAILIPALGGARGAARSTASRSDLRQHAVALGHYAGAEADALPFLGVPGDPKRGVLPSMAWAGGPPIYFSGHRLYWPTALLAHGIDLSTLGSNSRPDHVPEVVQTFMWLTQTAAARPAYWKPGEAPNERSLFAGVRMAECQFPANKGLLTRVDEMRPRSTTWDVAMFDGSVAQRSLIDPPVEIENVDRGFGAIEWRVLTTPDGIHGRDY